MFIPHRKRQALRITSPQTFQKWKAVFKTIDGETHEAHMNFVNADGIRGTVPQFLMTGKEYFKDLDGVMYPIHNVISINWVLVEERNAAIPWLQCDFQVVYSEEELDEQIAKAANAEKTVVYNGLWG